MKKTLIFLENFNKQSARAIAKKHVSSPAIKFIFEDMSISEAKQIASALQTKHSSSEQGPAKSLVVTAEKFKEDCQNTLLKPIEENNSVNIYFILPSSTEILPTLSSRFTDKIHIGSDSSDTDEEASKFLSMDLSEKFKYMEKLLKSDNSKTKLTALAKSLAEIALKNPALNSSVAKDLLKCAEYANFQIPNLKIIGNYLCISSHKIKN